MSIIVKWIKQKEAQIPLRSYNPYFFFFSQPIKNKMPIKNAGPAIVKHHDNLYHSIGLAVNKSTILIPQYINPARINAIAPTISCFQDISKIISKTNDGMLWINNPVTVPQNP